MAKFETPCQIVSLFIGAACVAALLIVLLTAEANKRQDTLENNDDMIVLEADDISQLTGFKYIWSKMRNSIRSSSTKNNELELETKTRKKREAGPEYYSNHVIEGEYDDTDSVEEQDVSEERKPSNKKRSHSVTFDIGSALLSSAIVGHKIRHIEEKVALLGEDSQLVTAVLDMYCNKEKTILYMMCMEAANITNKEDKNKTGLENNTVRDNLEHIDTNKTELVKNYKDKISSYISVMKNRLAPDVSGAALDTGICSSSTEFLVVVILTSFINFFMFVLISLFCRFPQKVKGTDFRESRENLVAGDDDLEIRDEDADQIFRSGWKKNTGNLHVNLVHQVDIEAEFNKQ